MSTTNVNCSKQPFPACEVDVISYDSQANFPAAGELDKLYIDNSTWGQFSWNGTAYVPDAGGSTSVMSKVTNADGTVDISHDDWTGNQIDFCVWGLLEDEDWRTTNLDCSPKILHRTLHINNLHSGSAWDDEIMVSHADSNWAAFWPVSTRHNRVVMAAFDGTTNGFRSITSGTSIINSSSNTIATWDIGVVSWGSNLGSWSSYDITGARNIWAGRLIDSTGNSNTLNGDTQNNIGSFNNLYGSSIINESDRSLVWGASNENYGWASVNIWGLFNKTRHLQSTSIGSLNSDIDGRGTGGNGSYGSNGATITDGMVYSSIISSQGSTISDTSGTGEYNVIMASINSVIQNTLWASNTSRQFMIGSGGSGVWSNVESGWASGIIGSVNSFLNVNTWSAVDDFGSVILWGWTQELTGQQAVVLWGRNLNNQSASQVTTGISNAPQGTSVVWGMNATDYAFITGNGWTGTGANANDNAFAYTWNGRLELFDNASAQWPTDATKWGIYVEGWALYYQGTSQTVTMLAPA